MISLGLKGYVNKETSKQKQIHMKQKPKGWLPEGVKEWVKKLKRNRVNNMLIMLQGDR